jgi:hypothetical protein
LTCFTPPRDARASDRRHRRRSLGGKALAPLLEDELLSRPDWNGRENVLKYSITSTPRARRYSRAKHHPAAITAGLIADYCYAVWM